MSARGEKREQVNCESPVTSQQLESTNHEQRSAAMRKLNVLLVDDNAQFLKAARDVVAALPCVASVECASSAAEALAQLGRIHPDLVLTDIMMPGMSGFEFIRQLRAGEVAPRVVAVTLHEGSEYRAAVRRSGAEDMICKREFSKAAPVLIAAMASAGDAS